MWDVLSRPVQEKILPEGIEVYVIDAGRIARGAGLAGRTNTVLRTCFFGISAVLTREQAIVRIKAPIAKTYAGRGAEVVERTQTAVDHALEFVSTVSAAMMIGRRDELSVSALPVDGTYPSVTV